MVLEVREVQPLKGGEEVVAQVVFEVARRAHDDAPHEKPEDAADGCEREQQHAVPADLVEGEPLAQVVDRVLQDPGAAGGDRGCQHHADETGDKSSAITRQVLNQATPGGHFRSIPARYRATLEALQRVELHADK